MRALRREEPPENDGREYIRSRIYRVHLVTERHTATRAHSSSRARQHLSCDFGASLAGLPVERYAWSTPVGGCGYSRGAVAWVLAANGYAWVLPVGGRLELLQVVREPASLRSGFVLEES